MMLPPTVREDLSDKPGLCCCCSTHISWHTYTHKHIKPKNKPTQKEIQREKLNMLNSVNCKKGCEICVGDKSGMQHFQRKAHFFSSFNSTVWDMLWLWTSKMLTNSYSLIYHFFSISLLLSPALHSCSIKVENTIILPFIKVHNLDFFFFFSLFSCLTFRLWQFYRCFSAFHLLVRILPWLPINKIYIN